MKRVLIIIFVLNLNSCFDNVDNEKPQDLISEENMVNIIFDMSLINVSKGINKRIIENNGMRPKSYILNKYNIDSIQFVNSNRYYSKDLEKYLMIYEKVLENLEINRKLISDSIDANKLNKSKRSLEIIAADSMRIEMKGLDKNNSKIIRN
nr:hypothetical protein [uncultured bacterium]|tara:strand:+ start:7160 stop:7612 length:453 start_codon:yes stop_codon:yes gene_type:complete